MLYPYSVTSYFCQPPTFLCIASRTYRVAVIVLSRVYRSAGSTHSHGLISVLSELKYRLVLVPVHALDDLGPDKGALCDDTLKGDHVVEMRRAQGAGVAGEFAETSNVCAVVNLGI